jgi:hypothetical protein
VVYKDNNAAYKLVSFTGSKQQGTSVLTWTVQNESDVYTFDLERSTDGGKTYSTIGTIQADRKGTYSVTDAKPVYGDNLYRLKQDDVNDIITYSDIVKLTYDMPQVAGTTINVYPNPTSNKINIDFTQTILNPLEVHLVNTNGKLIRKTTFNAAQHIEQEVGGLMMGVYIIDVYDTSSNKKISSSKFIKN